jgi:hypothetical protein
MAGGTRLIRWVLLVAVVVAAGGGCTRPGGTQTAHRKHTISVTFDYNFRLTPACSAKVTKRCVQRFVVYDMSEGMAKRTQLFVVAVPAEANGLVKGISGRSPELDFEPGKHLLAVTAQRPDGVESATPVSTTWITIP